jgi:integrase
MEPRDIILIQNTRVLMPSEYLKLRKAIATGDDNNQKYPVLMDFLLHTGMRLVEAQDMKPDMYRASRRVIAGVSCAKIKCKASQRTVMLSLPGCDAVEAWLRSGYTIPNRAAMHVTMKRHAELAGIGSEGVTAKMFRKTLASWLMACYPEMEMYISASMGHSRATLQKHYLGHGFPRAEVDLSREMLQGWGVAV